MRPAYASLANPRALAFALGVWFAALGAEAHAPEARAIAVTPDGRALGLVLPGFGLLWRTQPAQPFVYVCSALLGTLPSAAVPSFALFDDGTALWGSADGLRVLDPNGCPHAAQSELHDAPIVALAISRGAPQIAYAVASGSMPGLWRSVDGGAHWELRAALPSAANVTALVVSRTDPREVWLSETGPQGTLLRGSREGGANLTSYPQELPLTLLDARGGAKPQLWATSRDALTVGNRGRAILRAEAPGGPWQAPLRVAYFGGLVIDANGTISVGDELGALYQSDDDGESFRKLPAEVPVACLAQGGDARWACTPGLLTDPVLQHVDASAVFRKTLALADVDRLVSCRPELEVERVCAAAWVEWQRDVLRLPSLLPDAGAPTSPVDAGDLVGSQAEAGAIEADASMWDAGLPDAAPDTAHDAARETGPEPHELPRSCAARVPAPSRSDAWIWPTAAICLATLRRRRTSR